MTLKTDDLNKIKIDMLDTFFNNFNDIYTDFKENKIDFDNFLFNKKRLIDNYDFCRVDLKNYGNKSNSIRILESDENYTITYPDWFSDDKGQGIKLETVKQAINLKIQCINEGTLEIRLLGRDFRDHRKSRAPIHISYDKFIINSQPILVNNQLTWHDKPYIHNQNCNDNEIYYINITFNTLFDFFPKLLNLLNNFNNFNEINFAYDNLKNYIESKKKSLEINLDESIEYDLITEKLKDISNDNHYLTKRINELENEITTLNKNHEQVLDSYNLLFNNLFKYYDLKPNDLLKYSREITKQILDFIDNVCKKYDLQWWLYGGTLLGAYRHNGIIPWDDDCDIAMIRPDYEKFFDILKEEIEKNNLKYLQVSRKTITNNNTLLPFIKLEYRVEKKLIGFIDIFAADYISKIDENIESIYKYEHKKLRQELKNGVDRDVALNNAFKQLNVSKEPTDKIMSGVEDVVFSIVDYDTLFPLNVIQFEDRLYPCPNKTKKYIETCYGTSFMTIPQIVKNHGFLPHIERWEDVYELLKDNINYLKEINAKFR